MGEAPEVWEERIKLLRPYQVNQEVINLTGNTDVKFLHCLPAFHNRETKVGEDIYQKFGLESLEVARCDIDNYLDIVRQRIENKQNGSQWQRQFMQYNQRIKRT